MAISDAFPLGPCKIVFDASANGADAAVNVDITLKDEDTNFSSETDLYKIFVDQLDGAYMAQHIAGDTPAVFTCSVFVPLGDLPNLSATFQLNDTGDAISMSANSVNVMYGNLTIHPVSSGASTDFDIVGAKVSCNVALDMNFKSEDLAKADLTFDFSSDSDEASPTFGKTFTIGTFSEADVLDSIAITPLTATGNPAGTTQLVATGTYSVSGDVDITTQVTWVSNATDKATVGTNTGLVTYVDVGSALISCSLDSTANTAPCDVTVTAP